MPYVVKAPAPVPFGVSDGYRWRSRPTRSIAPKMPMRGASGLSKNGLDKATAA